MEQSVIEFGDSCKVNEVQIFNNPQFGEIRVLGTPNAPLFCAMDLCKALGYSNGRDAVAKHVDDDDVAKCDATDSMGRKQQLTYVTESGMYSLVIGSKLKTAKQFKKWVTSEVLPSIRKTGSYSIQNLSRKELALMVIQAEEENERLALENKQQAEVIVEQKPKVVFAEAIVGSQSSCLIGELAKIITQNGHKIGQNRLFEWLRKNHYLGTKGEYYNIPNQEYIERGLFEIKKTSHSENGVMKTTSTPKVTGKGQQYFVNLFLNGDNDLFEREIVLPNKEG
jgi:anti-repressor protein